MMGIHKVGMAGGVAGSLESQQIQGWGKGQVTQGWARGEGGWSWQVGAQGCVQGPCPMVPRAEQMAPRSLGTSQVPPRAPMPRRWLLLCE